MKAFLVFIPFFTLANPIKKNIDAVHSTGTTLYVFQFTPWEIGKIKNIKDTVNPAWKSGVKPNQMFQPISIAAGQSENYLVLDEPGFRIWQFDSSHQVVSSLPLPEELQGTNLREFSFFWLPGQRMVFINMKKGEVLGFQERKSGLRLLRRELLPIAFQKSFRVALPERWQPRNPGLVILSNSSLRLFDATFRFLGKDIPLDSLIAFRPVGQAPDGLPWLLFEKGEPVLGYYVGDSPLCYYPHLRRIKTCINIQN